jgi:hypothetical protein
LPILSTALSSSPSFFLFFSSLALKGVEYPFATDSAGLRNQWVAALDTVINSSLQDSEHDSSRQSGAAMSENKNALPLGAVGMPGMQKQQQPSSSSQQQDLPPGSSFSSGGGGSGYVEDDIETELGASARMWKRGNAKPTNRAQAKATAVARGEKLGLLKHGGQGAEADGFAMMVGLVVPQPEYAASAAAAAAASSSVVASPKRASAAAAATAVNAGEDTPTREPTAAAAAASPDITGSSRTGTVTTTVLPTQAAVAAALAPPPLMLVTGLGGSEATSRSTVDLCFALKLLEDRRFLRTRKAVEQLMKELLTYAGNPADVPRLVVQTHVRDENRQTRQHTQAATASLSTVAAAADKKTMPGLLSRLVEILSLEPIESPSTSRIVGEFGWWGGGGSFGRGGGSYPM